jgi:zinc protease
MSAQTMSAQTMRCSCLLVVALLGCRTSGGPASSAASDVGGGLAPERVIVRPSDTPVVELRIAYTSGSADDPSGKEGLTYLTAMTMLEGRAGELSFAERSERLFPMAADISAHVEREQTVFVARVHRDHLDAFYPMFRDVLRAPRFEAADFERVRARALSHLTQDLRGADDESLGKEVLQTMLFEGHPYAHPELGREQALAAIGRDDLPSQWARIFCASRVSVAAAGPVEGAFVETLRGDLAARTSERCEPQRALPPPSSISTRRVWIVDKAEAASVAISLGLPVAVTRAHQDFAALTLAASYLGQHRTFAGRLMQKMRGDRGLNYGDYAYAEHFVQDAESRFALPNVSRRQQYFSVWLRPVQPEHAHFALRMAVRELEQFVANGMTQADFERMQRFMGHYLALYAQTEQQRLGYALDDRFYGMETAHLQTLREQIRALTREQLMAAVQKHLMLSRLQVAMVAPRAAALGDALVAGAPSTIQYKVEKPAEVLEEDKAIAIHPLGLSREQVNVIPLASIFR